ncbi:MAG TPA: hypothetical protein VFB62_21725 [Polyangiaceae bacterium]|nr:hypothetical protein [Polyangiaceae bacterium]
MTTAVVCALSSVCHAQETEPKDWAAAIGIGWMGGGAGISSGELGAVGGWMPTLSATLERRLDERLWALVSARGHYMGARFGDTFDRNWALGGSVGLRHALTPPDPLEVSWYVVGDGGYARTSLANLEVWSAGLRLGLALDKHFTDWFGMRVSLDLAQAGYQRATSYDTSGAMVPAEAWFAKVTLAPSFALRFAF